MAWCDGSLPGAVNAPRWLNEKMVMRPRGYRLQLTLAHELLTLD